MEQVMATSTQQSVDLLASASSASQRSVDMVGVLMDSLTPERGSCTHSSTISPPRPKNLSAIFSGIQLLAQKPNQPLFVSQESTDMLVSPPKNTYAENVSPAPSQRQTNTGVEQSASNANRPIADASILFPHRGKTKMRTQIE